MPNNRIVTMRLFGDGRVCILWLAIMVAIATTWSAGCGRWESATCGAKNVEQDTTTQSTADDAEEHTQANELTIEGLKKYPNEDYQASIVQILAHRDRYHGKKVQIEGYLRVQFEGTAIYLSKEDADYGMTRNGFWVDLGKQASKYDRKYVLIEGTFDKDTLGHMSLWQGTIANVTRVVELTKHE